MADIKKTIELNGKLYDARTGRILNSANAASVHQPVSKPAHKTSPGVIMDGFTRSRSHTPAPANRKLEPSKTLMRPAVKKPEFVVKTEEKKRPQLSAGQQATRTRRAQQIPKSNLIKRFQHPGHTSSVSKVSQALPVAKPAHQLSNKVAAVAHNASVQVAPVASESVQLVERAIASSTSHLMRFEKDLLKKKSLLERVVWKNKIANLSSIAAVFVLLVGFFAWQNVAQVQMRVAATRAGVSAQLPGYSPAGFGIAGPIHTEPGKVSISFKSRTDDRQFTITQAASNWNSDSLLNNYFLSSNRPAPISYPNQGKTIYIYDETNATWVDGGVWYNIEGNSNLTTDQLLRLANSL